MTNDNTPEEVVRLIKSGNKDGARSMLASFLRENPNHIQAWLLEAQLFPNNSDRIKILEACLKHNPGNEEVTQTLTSLKKRLDTKEVKPMARGKRNAIIGVLALAGFFALIGLYLGRGFYLNRQINQAFVEQNCAAVAEYASFVSRYPEAIFASRFGGFGQYDECRLKLDLERALSTSNWGQGFTYTQEYLTKYPKGAFAAGISEQAPNILSAWSEQLIANHDYANGIDRLKQLIETYPASPPAQAAPDIILKTYLLWTAELASKQNYAQGEQYLKAALSYFQEDPARSEQIKQELAKLYVNWGDMQIQLGDTDNGIKHYRMAGEFSPADVDVELLVARVGLQKAMQMADQENFDAALEKVKEISDATQAESVKSEASAARETILAVYSVSTSQQAIEQMKTAISLTCTSHRPDLPIFGLDTEKIRFGLTNFYAKLPIQLAAESPSELRYVICIDETEEELQTCPYSGGYFLVRMRYVWKVAVHDILSGDKYASHIFKGSIPGGCPAKAVFQTSSPTSRLFGDRPTTGDIIEWLEKLKLTK